MLEEELTEAVEVKDRKSLRRYLNLMVGSIVGRGEYMTDISAIHSDIRVIVETIKEGFQRMDERFEAVNSRFETVDKRFEDMQKLMNVRFEAVDKRFEDTQSQMNSRFSMMFAFMTIGFTAIVTLMSIFRFVIT